LTGSAGVFPSIQVIALAGAAVNKGPDLAYGTASGNTIAGTPSAINEIIITGITHGSSAPTVDASFTLTDTMDTVGGQHWGSAMAYQIQSGLAAQQQQPVWTVGSIYETTVTSFYALPSTWSSLQSGLHANRPPASTQPDQAMYFETDYGTYYQNQGGVWQPSTLFGAPYYLPAGGAATVPLGTIMYWSAKIDSDEPTGVFLDVSGYLSEIQAGV
jgi:hypothetical protein